MDKPPNGMLLEIFVEDYAKESFTLCLCKYF